MRPLRTSRRAVLRGSAAGAALVVGGLALPSCASDQGPDPLEVAWQRARSDAALASAVVASSGGLAGRLVPVAETRRAHADALEQEIRRARSDRADALDAVPAPAPPTPPAAASAAVGAVRNALLVARDEGRVLAMAGEPYRCGLMASIAGACAAHAEGLA